MGTSGGICFSLDVARHGEVECHGLVSSTSAVPRGVAYVLVRPWAGASAVIVSSAASHVGAY